MANPYCIVDVFTDMALTGNPLAVVFDADNLNPLLMQQIAGEFNLSETVFICKPKNKKNTARLRIFTAKMEIPFAGHPTIGAAIALGLRDGLSAVRLEEEIGIVTAVVDAKGKKTGFARFSLPKLAVALRDPPVDLILANALNIQSNEIGFGDFVAARFSAGLEFICVPVRNKNVLKKIKPDFAHWENHFGDGHNGVFVYTQMPGDADLDYSARMFSPDISQGEDPATGSAVAALSGALEKFGGLSDGQHSLKILQGADMGRRSQIELIVQVEESKMASVSVGGDAIIVASGELDIGV